MDTFSTAMRVLSRRDPSHGRFSRRFGRAARADSTADGQYLVMQRDDWGVTVDNQTDLSTARRRPSGAAASAVAPPVVCDPAAGTVDRAPTPDRGRLRGARHRTRALSRVSAHVVVVRTRRRPCARRLRDPPAHRSDPHGRDAPPPSRPCSQSSGAIRGANARWADGGGRALLRRSRPARRRGTSRRSPRPIRSAPRGQAAPRERQMDRGGNPSPSRCRPMFRSPWSRVRLLRHRGQTSSRGHSSTSRSPESGSIRRSTSGICCLNDEAPEVDELDVILARRRAVNH